MPETAYRLSIAPELEPFRREIEYVCGFLESCHALVRSNSADKVLYYGAGAPAGAVHIPALLFTQGVRADGGGLYPKRERLSEMLRPGQCLLPLADNAAASPALGYDAIGLIFLLLSRLEERDFSSTDRYGRYPVEAALIPPQDGRLYPFADRAARDIAAALTGDPKPPSRARYQVKFTHDVDILRGYHRPLDPLWNAAGDLLKRRRPMDAAQRIRRAYFAGEPWSSFRRLMALSEQYRVQSCFYFMGPSDDRMDSPYVLHMPDLLRAVVGEVRARGHLVGFHPGFGTARNAGQWCSQRDGLQAVIGAPVREGRQHVLDYDAAVTPRIWSDAGMLLDTTPAYPEAVGFRTGSCRPHHAYDLKARRQLPLVQISTAVMEFGLFGGKYRDQSLEKGLADSFWAADVCREFGGTFTVLLHSGQDEEKLWRWAEALLDYAVH